MCIRDSSYTLYAIVFLLTAYFFVVMLIRYEFDPKIVRDLLIPVVFFFLGSYLGSPRSADKLMTFLIVLALDVYKRQLTRSAIRLTAPRWTVASSGSALLPSGSSYTT